MLILARDALGLTQRDLAEKLELSQGYLSKLEDGLLVNISEDILNKLEDVLDRPRHFYFQAGIARTASPSFYRKKSTLPKSVLRQCDARMNIHRLQVERLAANSEFTTLTLPACDPDEYRGAAEVARQVRRLWKLPRGPIKNVTEIAENAGCVVIHLDFGTRKLDGVSLMGSDNTPMIFLNPQFPPDRMRFTLAHELGHLIMHRIPSPKMEEEAHAFAAEFLMPSAEINSSFYPASLDKLARLKLYWCVSMGALLKQGTNIGAINERYARYLWMQMGKFGYREVEPHEKEIPFERPRLIRELIDIHLNDMDYSVDELSYALAMSRENFEEEYMESPCLRIVR